MPHPSLESLASQIERLTRLRREAGREDHPFEITACTLDPPPVEEIPAWAEAGVDRLVVKPWARTRDTLDGLAAFADAYAAAMER